MSSCHTSVDEPSLGSPMHLVAIGGSDAEILAALRARELDPSD